MINYHSELQALVDACESFAVPIRGQRIPWQTALDRARAALAETEPKQEELEVLARVASKDQEINYPSDLVLRQYCDDWFNSDPEREEVDPVELCRGAIELFARFGNTTPQPVPVSERLPGPEDCIANPRNGQGQWCWGWCVEDSAVPFSGRWRMMRNPWLADEASHWLPAHALPLPNNTSRSNFDD